MPAVIPGLERQEAIDSLARVLARAGDWAFGELNVRQFVRGMYRHASQAAQVKAKKEIGFATKEDEAWFNVFGGHIWKLDRD